MKSLLFAMLLSLMPVYPATAGEFVIETVAEGLEHPWAIVFLPDSSTLVTERAGRLRQIDANGRLSPEPVAGVPDAYVASQGGLMDIVLHPEFETNGWIYLSLSHGSAGANATRVVRGHLQDGRWVDNEVIFTAQPFKDTPVHYGGRMAFMNDGTLLISVGDGFDYREAAQSLESHLGTIVRIHDDGRIPGDNPFVDREDTLPGIYSYGHRNPQGMVVEPGSGRVWSHEHGPRGGDELNLVRAGQNYGWPVATHGVDYSGARVTPYATRPGLVDPLIVWTPSIAPAGMSRYRGKLFPEWQGDLLVASLVEQSIRRIRLEGDTVARDEIISLGIDHRLRDVQVGPDGALYVLTDEKSGKVLRITN